MIVIIDYGMGNLGSVQNMFKKVGYKSIISSDMDVINQATKLVLPGVGSFDYGMKKLDALGLTSVIKRKVIEKKTPILGICLGMQLLTLRSEEGEEKGLGLIDAEVKRFDFEMEYKDLKVPHMGWNIATIKKETILTNNMLDQENRFYFVHSFYVKCKYTEDVLMGTEYGHGFDSGFNHENIYGVQFHPEKSHKFGMQLMKNFSELG